MTPWRAFHDASTVERLATCALALGLIAVFLAVAVWVSA